MMNLPLAKLKTARSAGLISDLSGRNAALRKALKYKKSHKSEAFVKIDLHGLRQEEAIKVIDKAIAAAGPATRDLWR